MAGAFDAGDRWLVCLRVWGCLTISQNLIACYFAITLSIQLLLCVRIFSSASPPGVTRTCPRREGTYTSAALDLVDGELGLCDVTGNCPISPTYRVWTLTRPSHPATPARRLILLTCLLPNQPICPLFDRRRSRLRNFTGTQVFGLLTLMFIGLGFSDVTTMMLTINMDFILSQTRTPCDRILLFRSFPLGFPDLNWS